MHENREISSAPWSEDQGRSAKATSRTADMHVLEKSDCAVVPVNQPNKGGKPSAEAGEGRARAVENIVRSHMLPTILRRVAVSLLATRDLSSTLYPKAWRVGCVRFWANHDSMTQALNLRLQVCSPPY